uniref:Variant surface glycoprotein n=1 Tax=Trypanosoma brucei TaxID=5691 RepID=A0A1V0FYT6_9TRYP|nr:variant surface glycoprotein [Trypanosoma brucei]
MSQILNNALKLNLNVAEESVDVVLNDETKYKAKKDVDSDADKKGYFNLKTDDDLNNLRQLYKEVLGTDSGKQAFSKEFCTLFSKAKKQVLQLPIWKLYAQLTSAEARYTAVKHSALTTATEAKKAIIQVAYSGDAATEQTRDFKSATATALISETTFSQPSKSDMGTSCQEAGNTKERAGNALETDMLCIFIAQKSTRHDFCSGSTVTATN